MLGFSTAKKPIYKISLLINIACFSINKSAIIYYSVYEEFSLKKASRDLDEIEEIQRIWIDKAI